MKGLRPALLRLTAVTSLAALVGASSVAAAPCPTHAKWPTGGWTTSSVTTGTLHQEAVAALEKYAFTLSGKDADRTGIRTDSVVVIRGGVIRYEKYARGWTAAQAHEGWSIAKSITASLVAIAVSRGWMSISDSVCRFLPNLPQATCAVTVQNLLEFASGLDWTEEYENQSNQASSVLAMLYGEGHGDMAAFVGGHTVKYKPGTVFNYSSGEATLLAATVDEAMKPTLPITYPWTLLFNPLGVTSAVFERDLAHHLVGGSYVYATPRDYAKLGYFWLNDGCWENQRILPESWMGSSTVLSPAFRNTPATGGSQGRMFWINAAVPLKKIPVPWPDVPLDTFVAIGHWGQYVAMIPSLDLVIVRLGDDRDDTFDLDTFLKLAVAVGQ